MTGPSDGYDREEYLNGVAANHRHVSPREARDANDPDVGAGTPATAPPVTPPDWTVRERLVALLLRPIRR